MQLFPCNLSSVFLTVRRRRNKLENHLSRHQLFISCFNKILEVDIVKKNCFCLALLLFILVFSLPSFGESQGTETTWSCEPISIGINNSAALQGYIDKAFGIRHGIEITPKNATLTGINKTIYEQLVPLIQDIASGGRSSTVLEITVNGDLSEFNLGAVLHALLVNHPYDLYWFDKTQQTGCSYGSGHMTFSMKVASEYSVSKTTGTTEFDNTIPADISYAAARAHSIVSDNAGKNDYQKLLAYKDAICALVSYNDEAAGDNAHDYGNPWQLIWVFDDNPETNVVCEGYSKAFKYLCDLSQFRNSVSTSIVNGSMTGATGAGRHMWNLVNIGDGKNYLADITNCDEGTVGSPDLLFMVGYSSLYDNNGTSGYIFTANDSQIIYVYDSDIVDLYSAEELAVANGAYTFPADPQIVASGDCGENLTWTLDNEGWLNISGSGEMNHYGQDEAGSEQSPWFSHALEIQHVTLSSDVSTIGSYAFDSCQQLTTISLPKNLYDIGSNAFSGCNNLSDIFFGGTETRWQLLNKAENNEPLSTAHLHCSGQSTVWLSGSCGDHLTFTASDDGTLIIRGTGEMYDYSYDENNRGTAPWYDLHKEIYRVILQPGVTSIGSFAFADCFGLSIVSLPEGLLSIGNSAFYFCNLRNFVLPISLTSIGTDVFSRCDLTEIQYAGTSADWLNVSGCNQEDFQNISLHCSDSVLIAYGTCGDNLSWTLDDTGLLNIRGSGEMTHYETVDPVNNIVNSPWFSHIKTITSVSIGENVTSIGVGAFAHAVNLNSITIPAGVTNIAPWAFHGCSSLSEILVENGSSNFVSVNGVLYTKDLTSIVCYPAGKTDSSYNILDSVTIISASAFWGCDSLTSINIPNGVTTIQDQAFSRCGVLQFDIPDSVTSIGTYAFSICNSLTSVRLPAGLTELAEAIFAWSPNLSEITIPENVTNIGANAFSGTKITDINIPEGVTDIGNSAFIWCGKLFHVSIPLSVSNIRDSAFEGCYALQTVDYSGTVDQWADIAIGNQNDSLKRTFLSNACKATGVLENDLEWMLDHQGTLIITGTGTMNGSWDETEIPWHEYRSEINSVVVKPGVVSLGIFSFKDCLNLVNISLPNSLTEIQYLAFCGCESLTSFAIPANLSSFYCGIIADCPNIAEITVDPSNNSFILEDGVLYSADKTELLYYPPKRQGSSYSVPYSVTNISGAFAYCEYLTSVTLTEHLTEVDEFTFDHCINLKDIYYGGSPVQWNQLIANWTDTNSLANVQIHFAYLGAGSCGTNLRWLLDPSGQLTISGTGDMEEYSINFEMDGSDYIWYSTSPWYALRDQILTVNVESGVTSIGSEAFTNCSQLSSVSLPDTVTAIGDGAFRICSSLTSFTLPAGLTSIGRYAFANCDHLAAFSVAGGNTAFAVDDGVLFSYDLSRLIAYPAAKTDSSYSVPDSVTEIGSLAFAGCKSLTNIQLGSHVTNIGESAFEGCSSLTELTIPDSVIFIESFAFNYCAGLTSISLPVSVRSISIAAFNGCTALSLVNYKGTRAEWSTIQFGEDNDPLLNANIHFLPVSNLVLPSELTKIESEAFAGLPPNSIVFVPDSVTSIAEDAFDEGTIIVTPEGSPAAEWANTNGFECYEQ